MFMLMSHYRSPLNYSGEILLQAKAALERLTTAKENLFFISQNGSESQMSEAENALFNSFEKYRNRFIEAMDDDFNTADAIAVIFEMIRECNSVTAAQNPTRDFANAALDILGEFDGVLGLFSAAKKDGENSLDAEVEALIEARATARLEKNWSEADKIRDRLNEMGIVLEDTPQGVKWKKVQ